MAIIRFVFELTLAITSDCLFRTYSFKYNDLIEYLKIFIRSEDTKMCIYKISELKLYHLIESMLQYFLSHKTLTLNVIKLQVREVYYIVFAQCPYKLYTCIFWFFLSVQYAALRARVNSHKNLACS